jgi:hypothetical protein
VYCASPVPVRTQRQSPWMHCTGTCACPAQAAHIGTTKTAKQVSCVVVDLNITNSVQARPPCFARTRTHQHSTSCKANASSVSLKQCYAVQLLTWLRMAFLATQPCFVLPCLTSTTQSAVLNN